MGEHPGAAMTFLVKFSGSNGSHMGGGGECIGLCWQIWRLEHSPSPPARGNKASFMFPCNQDKQGAGINHRVTQPLPCYYNKQLEGHQTRAPCSSNRRFPACLLLGFTGGTLGVCRFFLCLLLSRDTTSKTPKRY